MAVSFCQYPVQSGSRPHDQGAEAWGKLLTYAP